MIDRIIIRPNNMDECIRILTEKKVDLLSARGTNGHDVIVAVDLSAAEPTWVWPVPSSPSTIRTFGISRSDF